MQGCTEIVKCLFALLLLLPSSVMAAGFACASPDTSRTSAPASGLLAELDEVTIKARKPTSRTKDLGAWMKRLEGQYRYEGHVDFCGNGHAADQRPVTGKADCAALYHADNGAPPTSLYCMINVQWPRVQRKDGEPAMTGESSLSPAVVVYGVVPDLPGIQFMQIDSRGLTTHAKGQLTGDTLITRESCSLSGTCQRVTQITARAGSKDIAMLVDIEIDSRRVLRHAFLMHRVSNVQGKRGRAELQSVGQR